MIVVKDDVATKDEMAPARLVEGRESNGERLRVHEIYVSKSRKVSVSG